jgi:hypothetical protein
MIFFFFTSFTSRRACFCAHVLRKFIGRSHPVEDVVCLWCLDTCRSCVASGSCNPLARRSPIVRKLDVFDRACSVRVVRAKYAFSVAVVHISLTRYVHNCESYNARATRSLPLQDWRTRILRHLLLPWGLSRINDRTSWSSYLESSWA